MAKINGRTLYYVNEGNIKAVHPLCDLFFRSEDGVIYLISITGGNGKGAARRVKDLGDWMKDYGNDLGSDDEVKKYKNWTPEGLHRKELRDGVNFFGVSLAPFADKLVDRCGHSWRTGEILSWADCARFNRSMLMLPGPILMLVSAESGEVNTDFSVAYGNDNNDQAIL